MNPHSRGHHLSVNATMKARSKTSVERPDADFAVDAVGPDDPERKRTTDFDRPPFWFHVEVVGRSKRLERHRRPGPAATVGIVNLIQDFGQLGPSRLASGGNANDKPALFETQSQVSAALQDLETDPGWAAIRLVIAAVDNPRGQERQGENRR